MDEMPIPLGRAFKALARSMIDLWAIAGTSAVVFLAAAMGGTVLARMHVPEAVALCALSAVFVILHAIYLVGASRAIAVNGDDPAKVETLSVFSWIRAVFGIVIFVAVIAAVIAVAVLFLTPYSPAYAVFMGTTAFIAWTPFLPMMAVDNRSILTAIAASAPDVVRFMLCAALTSLPFLAVTGLVAVPVLGRNAMSFGMFEGGIVAFPLLGLCLFAAVTTMALVPTVVYAALKPSMELSQ